MLGRNNKGISVPPNQETEIVSWVADEVRYLIGFTGTGTWSAEFRLYVTNIDLIWWDTNFPSQTYDKDDPWYVQQITPVLRNAYVADRGIKLPENAKVSLKVLHEAPTAQVYKGTILGG